MTRAEGFRTPAERKGSYWHLPHGYWNGPYGEPRGPYTDEERAVWDLYWV